MEPELEQRWHAAVLQKGLSSKELRIMVEKMEKRLTIPDNWNQRVVDSLAREKKAVEARYGIRMGQSEISCATCGRQWDFTGHNGCSGSVAHQDMLGKESTPKRPQKRLFHRQKGENCQRSTDPQADSKKQVLNASR